MVLFAVVASVVLTVLVNLLLRSASGLVCVLCSRGLSYLGPLSSTTRRLRHHQLEWSDRFQWSIRAQCKAAKGGL